MTGSIPNPRLEAAMDLTYRCQHLSRFHVKALLESIDRADEAAGIRRVPAQLHDALMKLYRVVWEETATMDNGSAHHVVMTHEDSFKITEAASAVEDILFPSAAADSPVGGVS